MSGSSDRCNQFAIMMNLRSINIHAYERLKEELRFFTDRARKRTLDNVVRQSSEDSFSNPLYLKMPPDTDG